MAKYVFDSILVPEGELEIQIVTNDDEGTTTTYSNPYFLKIAEIRESVEEKGIGGVLRIGDAEFELYDRDRLFSDTILDTATTSTARIHVFLVADSVYYSAFAGDIDLATVSYESYYDDEAGNETHSCKFVAFSLLARLREVAMTTLRSQIYDDLTTIGVTHWHPYTDGAVIKAVSVQNIFKEITAILFTGISADDTTIAVSDTYGYTGAIPNIFVGLDELYLDFYHETAGYYGPLFSASDEAGYLTTSFMELLDVQTFLKQLASEFHAYPVLRYDVDTGKFYLDIRQRGAGSVVSAPGPLLSSRFESFFGYSAVRAKSLSAPYINTVGSPPPTVEPTTIYPSSLTDDTFEVIKQSFDFPSYLTCFDGVSTQIVNYNPWVVSDSGDPGRFQEIDKVNLSGVGEISSFTAYHAYVFNAFWRAENPAMYERTYGGTGLATNPVQLLDKLTIGSDDYSIVEIRRDLIAGESTIKAVLY